MVNFLQYDILSTLARDNLDGTGVIVLNHNLMSEQLPGSFIATRGMKMLEYARDNGGIDLTKGGALNRKFLVWAVKEFNWIGFKPEKFYTTQKVIDEWDYSPGHYLHEIMKRSKMMRKHKDKLIVSPRGRDALSNPGLIQAALFPPTFRGRYLVSLDTAFMADFDLYFGLILWRVRHVADDWVSVNKLFLSAVADNDTVHEARGDLNTSHHIFYMRILRILEWFGLLECDHGACRWFDPEGYIFRITPLFDQFVKFNIRTQFSNMPSLH